jgi:protein ImuA
MIAAREACRDGRVLVVVDGARRFYPPAAATYGIGWENLIVVRPQKQKDYEWALNQSLHCPAVSAVVCWPEELGSRAYRRLQLAAETGGSLGLLIRPEGAVNKPSCSVELELDDETHTLHLAPELAPATADRRSTGA